MAIPCPALELCVASIAGAATGGYRHRVVPVRAIAAALTTVMVAALAALIPAGPASAQSTTLVINEIDYDQPGTDTAEFVEISNVSGQPIDLGTWELRLVNGTGGGATVYNTVALPADTLGAGDHFVVCANAATVDNCDLDASPDTNFIQNGAPDAVALFDGPTLVDTVSYEGDTGAPFTEGSGAGVEDTPAPELGISRFPDGADTDRNNVDLSPRCITPGEPNTAEATLCVPPTPLTVPEIQGDGQFSPVDGEVVETSGIVTLVSADGADMWIQDQAGDGDPATSDGIMVDDRNTLSPPPQVGDLVTIVGTVDELQFPPALPLTRIDSPVTVAVESSGNPLPDPVPFPDLPDVSVPDAIGVWEPLEGMLVEIANAPVVAATNAFGELVALTRDDARPGSGFEPRLQQILLRDLGGGSVDYNPERIMVDDQSLDDPIEARPGDGLRNLVGVVDYTFGNYKLQPVSFDVEARPLPPSPVSTRSGPPGDIVITTFNVENLFDLVDNPDKDDEGSTPTPAELETQLTKLAAAIEAELRLPEIVVVQEVENTEILQELGDRVNAAAGTDYVATSEETSDGRGIEVGFLWDAQRVDLVDAFQASGLDVDAAFGPGSASPGREPLVGVFDIAGTELTIFGNHFKSKSGDDPIFGVNQPLTRVTEEQRKLQAQVVRDRVESILDADPDALVLVTGDLNDFPFSEPGEGADNPVAILEGVGGGPQLTNLISLEKAAERFSFVFDGNSQVIDHTLVSPALLDRVVGADFLHFDASFPASVADDPATTIRAADHDPLEARLCFAGG